MRRKRVHAIIHGRVQGVAFREYTRREAERLVVSGWVQNRRDGTVEVLCEGEAVLVDEFVVWLAAGSPYAHVSRVVLDEEEPQGEVAPFFIKFFS
jgi:acylphosphatase